MPVKHKPIPIGTVFGEWTVTDHAPPVPYRGENIFRCHAVCSCGTERIVEGRSLKSGRSQSCGCKKGTAITLANTKHGMHKSKTYFIWVSMLCRCRSPTAIGFHNYGGRGIKVCDEWRDFTVFLRDMGEKPDGLSLERMDNEKGYEPSNCRWATVADQARNTRRTKWVVLRGERMCAKDAARALSMSATTFKWYTRTHNVTLQQAVDHYASTRLQRLPSG
jgi:hypothetical protein